MNVHMCGQGHCHVERGSKKDVKLKNTERWLLLCCEGMMRETVGGSEGHRKGHNCNIRRTTLP